LHPVLSSNIAELLAEYFSHFSTQFSNEILIENTDRKLQYTEYRQNITVHRIWTEHYCTQNTDRTLVYTEYRQNITVHRIQTEHYSAQSTDTALEYTE
jgi:hypothetical protein